MAPPVSIHAYAEKVLANLVTKVRDPVAARRILDANEALVRKCHRAGGVGVHPRAAAGFLVIRSGRSPG